MTAVAIDVSKAELNFARHHASRAEVGGVSRVRETATARAHALEEDQFVGQLGTLAFHKYLHGHVHQYALGRYLQNRMPTVGDGGEDVIGTNLDVKTSLMRASRNPSDYNLLVRPAERHAGWVYALALVPQAIEIERMVYLVGWATDEQLPARPEADGPFRGAFRLVAADLTPFCPIAYHLYR